MLSRHALKAGAAPVLIILVTAALPALACAPFLPSQPAPETGAASTSVPQTSSAPPVQQNPAPQSDASDNATAITSTPASSVQIKLIHFQGTLTRIGCCNPGLYERDEFVVIQNTGDTYVDIINWRLINLTKGYPTFIFPQRFPCVPYELPPADPITEEVAGAESYYTLSRNPAQSEIYRFTNNPSSSKPINVPHSEIDWAACIPQEPLDDTPMKPVAGEQGVPPRCILYPGQTILVFTDEVHCRTGGFSFNWGQGNIWNNVAPDTAVLYNARGEEVSRRSYFVGR